MRAFYCLFIALFIGYGEPRGLCSGECTRFQHAHTAMESLMGFSIGMCECVNLNCCAFIHMHERSNTRPSVVEGANGRGGRWSNLHI